MQWRANFIKQHGDWKYSKKQFNMALILKGICDFYIDIYGQKTAHMKDDMTKQMVNASIRSLMATLLDCMQIPNINEPI